MPSFRCFFTSASVDDRKVVVVFVFVGGVVPLFSTGLIIILMAIDWQVLFFVFQSSWLLSPVLWITIDLAGVSAPGKS